MSLCGMSTAFSFSKIRYPNKALIFLNVKLRAISFVALCEAV